MVFYSCVFVVVVPSNVKIGVCVFFLCGNLRLVKQHLLPINAK